MVAPLSQHTDFPLRLANHYQRGYMLYYAQLDGRSLALSHVLPSWYCKRHSPLLVHMRWVGGFLKRTATPPRHCGWHDQRRGHCIREINISLCQRHWQSKKMRGSEPYFQEDYRITRLCFGQFCACEKIETRSRSRISGRPVFTLEAASATF